MAYKLTKEALLLDLNAAFQCAKRHKGSKPYVRVFEHHLARNLRSLANDLFNHTYKPEPSSCFIVERPKKREVFAAQFRDRVVHHLYYNYTHKLFERTFIEDCYSCIPKRGTHYGITRLEKHIRQESHNYQHPCYALKLDKRGYFMHINLQKLLEIASSTLRKMAKHTVHKGSSQRWEDVLDMDFMQWLTCEIVMLDPKTSCKIAGNAEDWEGLDRNKSLFYTPEGCGLPIGNLTSQLLSNVYLNVFDQFMKRVLKCKHYGRYVDDSYVISRSKSWLLGLVPRIQKFLKETLGLELHMGKLHVMEIKQGVEFLGAFVKPYRTYVSNASLARTWYNMRMLNMKSPIDVWRSVNSFLGMMSHYSSFKIRCEMFLTPELLSIAAFDNDVKVMYKPYKY